MIAVTASRTHAPKLAQKMLSLIHINGKPSANYLTHKTWGVGSKITHFQEIKQLTGVDFEDMVFFDDEMRNRDVQDRLGVTFVLVNEGVTRQTFDRGIESWRKRIRQEH
jgi:magnesium-dependent phosphatase 1